LGSFDVGAIYEQVAFYLFFAPSVSFKQHAVRQKLLDEYRMARVAEHKNEVFNKNRHVTARTHAQVYAHTIGTKGIVS